jgi:nucleoporin NDC1
MLAILQASLHLYFDYDCLDIPVAKRDPKSPDQRIHPVDSVFKRIQKKTAEASSIYAAALLVTAASPFIYLLFLRRLSWSFSLYFAKLFWNFPRSAAVPPGRVPLILFTLFGHQALSGLGLLAVWQSANIFFTVFITQEPLKRGQPLTTETKDPTGSLINGLKAKKATVKTFAFWELSFISLRVPDRRKAIFSDIDRQDGPAWTQILHASVENVKNITARISHYKNPAPLLAPKSAPTTQAQLQTLPQLTEPPRHENILVASPKAGSLRGKFEESVGAVAKSYGQATDWTPTARAKAKEAFTHASNAMLSPERKKKLLAAAPEEARLLTGPPGNPSTSSTAAGIPFITQFLRSPIGKPFRQTYSRRLRSIVLGSPDGQLSPIVDAIDSMTRLLIASLAEDPYGKVQTDIPAVVRLFTDTIITLEGFVHDGLDIHWTDVTFPPPTDPEAQEKARHVHEVDTVLNTLRASLSDLLAAFTPYLSDVGLRGRDLRLAKVAADLSDETD